MKKPSKLCSKFSILGSAFVWSSSLASTTPTELEGIRVWGQSSEDVSSSTAPVQISKEKIQTFQYTDVNRALKQAPGIYIREEEGQGLRPNIGLRGTNPDRSKKVVLMEDGILSGPAPYSAPAAYYVPSMSHVENLEVFKGFSSVVYGPNSVGGAINYVTREIPDRYRLGTDLSYGAYGTASLKASVGSREAWGSYLVEASRFGSEGFKRLDGGGDTGFGQNEVSAKLRKELPSLSSSRAHSLELRTTYASELSHETYLGLSGADFLKDPYRRYSSSAKDLMKWRRLKLEIEHTLQLTDASFVKTSVYRHNFHRAWYRLDRFNDSSVSLLDVINHPTGSNQVFFDIVNGSADSESLGSSGQLIIANNDRDFYSQGIQSNWSNGFELGSTHHELGVTLRLHQDGIVRDHRYDLYEMTSGQMVRTDVPTQQDLNNSDSAFARTLSFQDEMTVGRWTLTGLARYENVSFEFRNLADSTSSARTDSVFVPGAGALYRLSDQLAVRTSVNRAVTVAGIDSAGTEANEQSTNYEIGFRYSSRENRRDADAVFFYNDYRNITGTCAAAEGCAAATRIDQQFNGGQAAVRGIEARLSQGLQLGAVWVPVQLNATWIQGVFSHEFTSTNPEWGIGLIREGDPLPYVPEIQYSLLIGTEYKRFKQEIALVYQGRMFDQSVSAGRSTIDPYGVLDWAGQYEIGHGIRLSAKVDNALGRDYVASLRPFGYRPGKPRTFMVGLSYVF